MSVFKTDIILNEKNYGFEINGHKNLKVQKRPNPRVYLVLIPLNCSLFCSSQHAHQCERCPKTHNC